jgi:hypothetical protein
LLIPLRELKFAVTIQGGSMRVSIPLFVGTAVASLLAGAAAPIAYTQSQAQASTVYVVAFMKVPPANIREYLQLERELWKPVHQERIRAGRLKSWSLYRVRYPYGAATDYNFVTVNGYASLGDDDRPIDDIFAKIHPSMTAEQIRKRTFDTRSLENGEAWDRLEHID